MKKNKDDINKYFESMIENKELSENFDVKDIYLEEYKSNINVLNLN